MWLKCIGVVSECCCKEVCRYPQNNYYFSLLHLLVLALFGGSASLLLCSFLKMIFRSFNCISGTMNKFS